MSQWSPDEDVLLLSWLDFCRKNEIDFLKTIQGHLENAGISRSRCRNRQSAQRHLQYLEWKYRKPDEQCGMQSREFKAVGAIIEGGSKCVKYIPREIARRVRIALGDYKKKYNSKEIQNLINYTPEKIKATKVQVEIPNRRAPPQKTQDILSLPKRGRPPNEIGRFGKRNLQEDVGEGSRKKRCLKKDIETTRPKQKDNITRTVISDITASLRNGNQDSLPRRPFTRAAKFCQNKELEIRSAARSLSVESQDEHYTVRSEKFGSPKSGGGQGEEKTSDNQLVCYREELQIKDTEIKAIREHWDFDVRILHGKIEKLEQTRIQLEAKVSNQDAAAIDVRNAGRDPLQYEIGRKNMEIWRLTEKIHQQFEVSSFNEKQAKYLPPAVIDTAMNEIRLELEAMIQMQDFTRMLSLKGWFGGDLEHLVSSAFASSQGSIEGKFQLRRLGGRLGPSAVFSILAITALKDWVFLTEFPHIELGSLSLLESYRNFAFKKGGWNELKCLDFGAFKENMKQP